MYPCLILPTRDLLIGHAEITQSSATFPLVAIQPSSSFSSSSSTNRRILDEKTGLAILTYVYDRQSLFNNASPVVEEKKAPVSSFFVLPEKKPATERSFIEKSKLLWDLRPVKENIRFIDKWFLQKHGITVNILLTCCKVEITNLKAAGIISNYEDLCELDFKLNDLVVNRELFNVNHMAQLFNMDANSLGIILGDLLSCKFLPAELMALNFSLPALIDNGGILDRHLHLLGYDLSSLRQLGLTREHLKKLGITYPIAINVFKWSPSEMNQMV